MLLKVSNLNMLKENLLGLGKLFLLNLLDSSKILPLKVRYIITDFFAAATFIIVGSKRKAVKRNLSYILGCKPSMSDIWKVFKEYGRYWAELPALTEFWSKMPRTYEGDTFPPSEKAFLGLTFHIGNFEVFGNELHRCFDSSLHVVAERLRPQILADYFKKKRRLYHVETICHDDTKSILKILKSGETLGVVCDRMISGKGVEARLFGRRINLPLKIVAYALNSKIPVYVAYCVKDKGSLKIVSKRIEETASFEHAIGKITSTLESAIRQYPHQWHVLSPM